ncbi:hypothetical protein CRE_13303 [Caenorhabditis remanei]|uniref:CCHC-type domain-containing protein n=1 Tax=Caenorhabditis remanei TaxID=31234 RepID=E3M837_CAERE|nr:hypothetical protein CRE_13303 [Caenorhabditis remanei]
MTDEGQVPATGSFSMELMRQFKDEFLEMIAPELLAMRKGEEKVPELSQKGLQKQAEINVQVINMLNNGAADLGKAVEEVVDLLKRRNQELLLLDKDPSALKNVEKLRAIAAVTSSEGSNAGDAKLMALAQIMSQGGDNRNQRSGARRQWFPAAGFGGRQSGVRNFSAYSQRGGHGGERAFGTKRQFNGSSTSGDFPKRSQIQCFSCGEIGHYSTQCGRTSFWEEKLESGGMIRDMEEEFEPQCFLFTDASAEGLGAVLKNGSGQTVMRMSELGGTGFQNESSALRELRAVQMAVERMASWKRGAVLIHTDSQAAVIILRKGSMRRTLQIVAERVWESLRSIGQAKFIWIPREQNKEADEASRDFDYDDWAVQNWAFEWAQKRWGEVKCDWFADEQNTKTELFFSRLPEPGTLGADVFEHVDKAGAIGLAWWVPPPALIPRLMRVARQKKLRGILATPLWIAHPSYQALVNERGEFIPEIRDSRIFKVNTKIISPEGEKLAFVKNMINSLGPGNLVKAIEFLARAALEGKAPSTARDYLKENAARRKWIQNNGLPLNETSTLIYLASREQNKEADEASRDFDYDDWAVQNWAFEWAQKRWGEVKCDWFADEQNTKTELFFSRLPEPGTLGADVFEHVDKAGAIGLAWWVPPPALIPRLMRVARQKKLRGILATPLWKAHPSYQALVNERGEFIPEIRDSRIFKVNTKIISPGRGSQRGERMASEFCRSPFMLAIIDFSF